MDLRASLEESIVLKPLERKLIPTGLFLALPSGYEAQIRPRSGLAFKHGLTILNSPGTIDADYRGELKVLLINHGSRGFEVVRGMRVAQLVVARYLTVDWWETDELEPSNRGSGGFGSTGSTSRSP